MSLDTDAGPITREDFIEGVREFAEDLHLEEVCVETEGVVMLLRDHDPVLADKITQVIAGIRDIRDYCRLRLESRG